MKRSLSPDRKSQMHLPGTLRREVDRWARHQYALAEAARRFPVLGPARRSVR